MNDSELSYYREHLDDSTFVDAGDIGALVAHIDKLRDALVYVRPGLENAWWSVVDEALEP